MANAIEKIIINEEKKCDVELLNLIIRLVGENKSFEEITKEAGITLFDLSTYIEVAFYKTNYDPSLLIEKEKIHKILEEFEDGSFPSLKRIKSKYPECEYTEIRAVRGVYFRTKRYIRKKPKKANDIKEKPTQLSLFDNLSSDNNQKYNIKKVELSTIPFLLDILNKFETPHWKEVAIECFEKYTPKQFYLLPASTRKKHHHETEQSIGEFSKKEPTHLLKMGGKYYHSYRVYETVNTILEPDNAEIWDFKREKIKDYIYGNEFEAWQRDVMRFAALSHDIYSGGTKDEFNPNMKRMDKRHAHYHKEELKDLAIYVPENEWYAYIMCVDSHMWKWDPEKLQIKFHDGKEKETVQECYEFYSLYRMVKNVELADFIASRRDNNIVPRFRQAINTWYHIKADINMTWEDLEAMGIEEKELRIAFAKPTESVEELVKLVVGDKFNEMKNTSLM